MEVDYTVFWNALAKHDLGDTLSTLIVKQPGFINLFPTKASAKALRHEWLEDSLKPKEVAYKSATADGVFTFEEAKGGAGRFAPRRSVIDARRVFKGGLVFLENPFFIGQPHICGVFLLFSCLCYPVAETLNRDAASRFWAIGGLARNRFRNLFCCFKKRLSADGRSANVRRFLAADERSRRRRKNAKMTNASSGGVGGRVANKRFEKKIARIASKGRRSAASIKRSLDECAR